MTQPQYTHKCPLAQPTHSPPPFVALLDHAQAGCPDCLNSLLAQHDPLVHWVIRRFGSAPLPYDEALQAGRIGLWQALTHFDPARGRAFSSYAVVAILRHIRQEGQRHRRFWRPLSALPSAPAPDPLEEVEARIEQDACFHAVHRWVVQLPPRLAFVLRAYYGLDGAPPQFQRTIAQTLGLTHQRISQLLRQADLLLALPLYSWEVRRLRGRTSAPEVRAALRAWHTFRRRRALSWRSR